VDLLDWSHSDLVALYYTGTNGAFNVPNLPPDSYLIEIDPTCFQSQSSDYAAQLIGGDTTPSEYTVTAGSSLLINNTIYASTPPELANMTVAQPTVGIAYSISVAPFSGLAPYLWSATNLPAGLSINSLTGQISGIPTSTGSFTASLSAKKGKGVPTGVLTASTVESVHGLVKLKGKSVEKTEPKSVVLASSALIRGTAELHVKLSALDAGEHLLKFSYAGNHVYNDASTTARLNVLSTFAGRTS
jgi:hypothetical protein